MSKMDDLSEKHDWRRVAVALAGVTRVWLRDEGVRQGRADLDVALGAAAERTRLAEADAETEMCRAERAEADARIAWAEVDDLTARLDAAKAQAPTAPDADPSDELPTLTGEIVRQRAQIDTLYADLNALRAKQLDSQARCDKAIQARIEAQRERAAAEKERDELAAMLADVHSQEGAVKALAYENKSLADRLLSAQKDRDAAIKDLIEALTSLTEHADQIKALYVNLERAEAARDQALRERDKARATLHHNTSEIESLRGKNKRLSDDADQFRGLREDANRARNEARAGLERVQAANAKLAAELEAERAKAGGQ